jgi:hypothetical protein
VADLARAKRAAVEGTVPASIDEVLTAGDAVGMLDGSLPETGGGGDESVMTDSPVTAASTGERSGPPLRFSWVHVAGVAVIVFLAVVGGITALELVAGRPLSSWWTDDASTGTTIGKVVTPRGSTPTQAPTVEPSTPAATATPTTVPTVPATTVAPSPTIAPSPTPTNPVAPTTAVAPGATGVATP